MPTSLTDFFKQSPTWLVSVTVHLGVMLVALMIPMAQHVRQTGADFLTIMEDVSSDQEMDATTVDQVGTFNEQGNYAATEIVGSTTAAATVAGAAGPQLVESVDQNVAGDPSISLDIGDGPDINVLGSEELLGEVTRSGGSVENTAGGTAGAIDRITQELQASLRQSRTLVMWAFDCTPSLKERRNMIADRFENVYRQLDALEATKTNGLTTVVASYADKFNLLTKEPVTDVRQVISKVREIKDIQSDKENTFNAVKSLATQFQRYRKDHGGQKMMMILITDEKGSDEQIVDETILLCRRYNIRVFVVGNSTLFGRAETFIRWDYGDGGPPEDVELDGGPETVEPEALALGFWGAGDDRSLTRMSSGYGPYALTRLCRETGGMYFVAETNAQHMFDASVMRNYQPDYRPAKEYMLAKQKSPAKIALVAAAQASKEQTIQIPPEVFRADTDNALKTEITEAQKPAAVLAFQLNKLYPLLQAGEKDREKLKEPRWRAGYDLAMGRVLAMKVRFEGYNKMLAEMKSTPQAFKKKESNQWKILASKEILAGADIKKMEKQASAYLKRVIDEHPGTPWATLAAKELGTPMGWQWVEAVGNYPKENMNESPEQNRIRLAREKKEREERMKNAPPPRKKPLL